MFSLSMVWQNMDQPFRLHVVPGSGMPVSESRAPGRLGFGHTPARHWWRGTRPHRTRNRGSFSDASVRRRERIAARRYSPDLNLSPSVAIRLWRPTA